MTILVLADEPVMCLVYRRVLSAAGYAVDTASDETTALRLSSARAYAAVIADVCTPRTNAVALLGAMRRRRPNVAGIVVTASAAETLAAYGADRRTHLLQKPFESLTLIEAVRSIVRRSDRFHSRSEQWSDPGSVGHTSE